MPRRASVDRPLKPLVFEILLALASGPSHGWTIVRSLQERSPGTRILPGHFYRTLSRALNDGLIESAPAPGRAVVDVRRRYFRLTPLGQRAAAAEARRLEALVAESRAKRLLSSRSRS